MTRGAPTNVQQSMCAQIAALERELVALLRAGVRGRRVSQVRKGPIREYQVLAQKTTWSIMAVTAAWVTSR